MTANGATFTDDDVANCRIIIGILNSAESIKIAGVKQVFEANKALIWLQAHKKVLEDNILEVKTVVDMSGEPEPPDVPEVRSVPPRGNKPAKRR